MVAFKKSFLVLAALILALAGASGTVNGAGSQLPGEEIVKAGFDTGFTIANTSVDPFGTAAQAGTCTLNYYGSHIVWILSGGNATPGITGTPGFQGHIKNLQPDGATAPQFVHGFTSITDGFGGARRAASVHGSLFVLQLK